MRFALAIALLTAASSASADYVVSGSGGIVAYRDDGTRITNYVIGDIEYGEKTFIDETVDAIAVDALRGKVYSLGNSLGTMSLRAFDTDTGRANPFTDPPLQSGNSDWLQQFLADYEASPTCDSVVSGLCLDGVVEVGRITRDLLIDSKGVLWGFGEIDVWRFNPFTGVATLEELNIGQGLHRYEPGVDAYPKPTSYFSSFIVGENNFGGGGVDLAIRADGQAFLSTRFGALEFDPEVGLQADDSFFLNEHPWMHPDVGGLLQGDWEFRNERVMSLLFRLGDVPALFSYDTVARELLPPVSLDPLRPGGPIVLEGENIVDIFFSDVGELYVLLQRPFVEDLVDRRVVVLDPSTGELIRVGENSLATDFGTGGFEGHYLRTVPEPAAALALLLATTLAPRRANHAHR